MTTLGITLPQGVQITAPAHDAYTPILSHDALLFLASLHRAFEPTRQQLIAARAQRQAQLDQGKLPTFPPETAAQRAQDWSVAPTPAPLQQRHVEITGPVDAKMVINALNSGADVFMADFEDANSPTWQNTIEGQLNLSQAIRKTLSYQHPKKGTYSLNPKTALLLVRPRGWHLPEKHILVDDQPMSAALVDFGLYFFHNAQALIDQGLGPYFYLPKLESYLEARLWNDVFTFAQQALNIPHGTIKATVLLEHILLAFQIDEVLFELKDHIVGINAGRWDYIFSAIKKFKRHAAPFPDRGQITMTSPFMKAYTTLLVQTCHRRNAHAMGGMAAFIPSRDPEINAQAFEKVRADKLREVKDGFDGTWVAHPGLVPIAKEIFERALEGKPHQKDALRQDATVSEADLINFNIPHGTITEAGLRLNLNVGVRYIASWLCGQGAAAIHNLMEDAATAEISRSQVWQWLHQGATLADGRTINQDLYQALMTQELDAIKAELGPERFQQARYPEAKQVFDAVATSPDFPEFLTLVAYELLD